MSKDISQHNAKKPFANRISQWGNCDEILYTCPNCDCDFGFQSFREQYCHKCGQLIDWGVYIQCGENAKRLYHEQYMYDLYAQKCILQVFDNYNMGLPMDNTPRVYEKKDVIS